VKNKQWQIGEKISLSDCVNKTGVIEIADLFSKTPKISKVQGEVSFGKHKGKTYGWIKKHDAGYFRWACETIPRFEKDARKYSDV